jgi:hypothetical protein
VGPSLPVARRRAGGEVRSGPKADLIPTPWLMLLVLSNRGVGTPGRTSCRRVFQRHVLNEKGTPFLGCLSSQSTTWHKEAQFDPRLLVDEQHGQMIWRVFVFDDVRWDEFPLAVFQVLPLV